MKIVFLGNFGPVYSSENHHAQSLESLGHQVLRLQENRTSASQILRVARTARMLVWVHTHDWHIPGIERTLATLRGRVPVVAYHLDLYMGIPERFAAYRQDPYLRAVDHFFTVDSPLADWLNEHTGVKGHYLPPGVLAQECTWAPQPPAHEVIFVGSRRYHQSWPYRGQLIYWLQATYGNRFELYGQDGGRVMRGMALNHLYASTKVVVGDSFCPNFDYGPYFCVDEDTLALTHRGWKPYHQISPGDLLYTLNPQTGKGEWSPALAVNIFPSTPREMLRLRGQRHSSLTTLDHRWVVHSRVREGRRVVFRASRDLKIGDSIPLGAPCANLPSVPTHADAFVELVAWAWTEGGVDEGRYRKIYQSTRANPEYVDRIRSALTELYGPPVPSLRSIRGQRIPAWREAAGDHGMVIFVLNKQIGDQLWSVCPHHRVDPGFVFQLTHEQLQLFVDVSIAADGCRKGGADTIAQKEAARLDAFEMACALLGIPTSRCSGGSICWTVHLKRRRFTAPLRAAAEGTAKAEIVVHDGAVWCPTTANGTWLAMKDGKVFFTGNSDRVTETTGRGGMLIHPRVSGIGECFKDGEEIVLYDYNDFAGLKATIDHYLAADDEREAIRAAGHERTKAEHTYTHRWAHILDEVFK